MRRSPFPTALVIVVLLALLAARAALAQDGTPSPADPFAGQEVTPLAVVPLDALPPTPAELLLVRATVAPGAELPVAAVQGALVGIVEAGSFAVHGAGPVFVTRASGADAATGLPAATPATDFSAGAGDQIVAPPGTAVTYRNAGSEPATFLLAGIVPADGPWPVAAAPGVTEQTLGSGVATVLPDAPAVLLLVRVIVAPGVQRPPAPNPGPILVYDEAGLVGDVLVAGESLIEHGAAGTIGPLPATVVAAGTMVIEHPGDAEFQEAGVVSGFGNPGTTPASLLLLTVLPLNLLPAVAPPEVLAAVGSPTAGTPAP